MLQTTLLPASSDCWEEIYVSFAFGGLRPWLDSLSPDWLFVPLTIPLVPISYLAIDFFQLATHWPKRKSMSHFYDNDCLSYSNSTIESSLNFHFLVWTLDSCLSSFLVNYFPCSTKKNDATSHPKDRTPRINKFTIQSSSKHKSVLWMTTDKLSKTQLQTTKSTTSPN